jgi:tetratricopeptide (TPR) repeat protein
MAIRSALYRLTLQRLLADAYRLGGDPAAEALVRFLTTPSAGHVCYFAGALDRAADHAWLALEIALEGDPLWERGQDQFARHHRPREMRTLRRQVRRFLARLSRLPGAPGPAFRQQCLRELQTAHLTGALDGGDVQDPATILAQISGTQLLLDPERLSERELDRELDRQGYLGLHRLLLQGRGLPLLVLGIRISFAWALKDLLSRYLQESPDEAPADAGRLLDLLRRLNTARQVEQTGISAPGNQPGTLATRQPLRRTALPSRPDRSGEPSCHRRSELVTKAERNVCPTPGLPPPTTNSLTPMFAAAALTFLLGLATALVVLGPNRNARPTAPSATLRQEEQRRQAEEERRREEALARQRLEKQRQQEEWAARQRAAEERARQEEERLTRWREAKQLEQDLVAARRFEAEQRRLQQLARQQEEERKQQARAAFERGREHAAYLRFPQARDAFTEALVLDYSYGLAYRERGLVWRRLQDAAAATADFDAALQRDPNDLTSLYNRGELYAQEGNHSLAIAAFSVVIRLDPRHGPAYRERGACYCQAGDLPRALADARAGLQLAPQDAWGYYHRARAHALGHDSARALADYTAALERDPSLTAAHRARAALLLEKKLYPRAIADYTAVLLAEPDDTRSYRDRGYAYLESGNWDAAIADFTAFLNRNPTDVEAYKCRGMAYQAAGQAGKARADFSQVLRFAADAEVFYRRARASFQLGDVDEALFDCNDAIARKPGLAAAYHLRGALYSRLGQRSRAEEDLQLASSLEQRHK